MFSKKPEFLDLEELRVALGEPEAVFAARRGRIWAGIFACVVIWVLGIAFGHRLIGAEGRWYVVALGLLLSPFAAAWLWWLRGCLGIQVWVYPDALLFVRRRRAAVFAWASLSRIQEANKFVFLTRGDGVVATYHPDVIAGAARLTAIVRCEAERHGIPWVGQPRTLG